MYRQAQIPQWEVQTLCILFLCFLILATFRLTSFPEPDTDESWDGAPAYALVTEGRLRNPVLSGREYYGEHVVRPRITLTLLVALAYKILGVGLWQGRIVSVLFGALTLLATWWYTRTFLGSRTGLLACGFLGTNGLMLHMTRMVRPEALEAALTMTGLYALTRGLEGGPKRLSTLAGLLVGVGLYAHATMWLMAVSLCGLFVVRWGPAAVKRAEFWLFLAGVVIGLLPYAGYLVLQDLPNGFHHFRAQLSQHGRAVLDTSGWLLVNIAAEKERYLAYIRFPVNLVPFVVAVASFAIAITSRAPHVRDLVTLVGVYVSLLAIFIRSKMAFYLLLVVPPLSILQATLILAMLATTRRRRTAPGGGSGEHSAFAFVGAGLALLVLANQLARIGGWVWKYRGLDFPSFIAKVRSPVRPEDKIWAPLELWPAFYDHDMRSDFTYLQEFPPCSAVVPVDVQRVTFRPNLVVLPQNAQYPQVHQRMRRIVRYLRGRKVASFDDRYYGQTEIFRIDWSAAPQAACPRAPKSGCSSKPLATPTVTGLRNESTSATWQLRLMTKDKDLGGQDRLAFGTRVNFPPPRQGQVETRRRVDAPRR